LSGPDGPTNISKSACAIASGSGEARSITKLWPSCRNSLAGQSTNYFRFRLDPGEISLSLSARVKRPGEDLVSMRKELSAVEEKTADEVDACERLLGDAMHEDAMLFVRDDAVEDRGNRRS
jgi:glucose-6-phosphate 1-dehydrogenase